MPQMDLDRVARLGSFVCAQATQVFDSFWGQNDLKRHFGYIIAKTLWKRQWPGETSAGDSRGSNRQGIVSNRVVERREPTRDRNGLAVADGQFSTLRPEYHRKVRAIEPNRASTEDNEATERPSESRIVERLAP
jgi:hypothetical protein